MARMARGRAARRSALRALLLALLLATALRPGDGLSTTSSSESSDAAAASPADAALGSCGLRAPACTLAVAAADASIAGTYDVTVRAAFK